MKKFIFLLLLSVFAPAVLTADGPHWAYPIKVEKNMAPGEEEPEPRRLAGSSQSYTQAQIDNLSSPPDWFPDQHAPMPAIVQRANGTTLACASCHLVSGHGHPESSHLSGLTAPYILRQLADFKSGDRKEPTRMGSIVKSMTEDEMKQAAQWFSSLKAGPWTKVVETDTVPKSYIGKGRMRFVAPGNETEPLGLRVVELPEDPIAATKRDPRSGFVAYVPKGSVAKGAALVTTGGAGKTMACAACHGADLKGVGDVPRIAGISPLYAARQLLGLKNGDRGGNSAVMMKAVAANLGEEEIVSIVAYLATLAP